MSGSRCGTSSIPLAPSVLVTCSSSASMAGSSTSPARSASMNWPITTSAASSRATSASISASSLRNRSARSASTIRRCITHVSISATSRPSRP
jgi:hypothetical protein